jgi:formylglycine-generating enzyme required for sulfatase activity
LTRQAVLLAADGYRTSGRLSADARRRLSADAADLFARDESAAVHAAAEWLLRRLDRPILPPVGDRGLTGGPRSGWRVTAEGHTLVIIPGPAEFLIGSPEDEPRREPTEDRRPRRIDHAYAIGMHEVTVGQFKTFFEGHRPAGDVSPRPDCPVNRVSWFDAARYCRRLSEAEGVPEREMVYPPVDQIRPGMVLPADWPQRTGYRLPTEAEWEYACRAGTTTAYFFGTTDDGLSKYGWWAGNSDGRCGPVGSLRPNPFGLFDVLGNVTEWCFDRQLPYADAPAGDTAPAVPQSPGRVLRGGSYQHLPKDLRSAKRSAAIPQSAFSYQGFRVARTVRPDAP